VAIGVKNSLCYSFNYAFDAGQFANYAGTQARFVFEFSLQTTKDLIIWYILFFGEMIAVQ
jgi:hypothetical protein